MVTALGLFFALKELHGEKPKIVWCYFDTLLMEKSNLIFYFYDHLWTSHVLLCSYIYAKISDQQECIPVGCILPTHWPYLVKICHTCPPTMHAPPPLPCMLPCHACPPAMHAPTMHVPLPCTPCHVCPPPHTPPHHACPLPAMHAPYTCPPAMHTPLCGQNSWHMLLKILPCPNFVVGGNKKLKSVIILYNEIHAYMCILTDVWDAEMWCIPKVKTVKNLSLVLHYCTFTMHRPKVYKAKVNGETRGLSLLVNS